MPCAPEIFTEERQDAGTRPRGSRALLAAIDTGSLTGLRDRALIGVMIYTFARVGAVLQMNVGDYFSQGRRGWVRLHEKGGKEHEAPCVPKLEAYLDEYIAAAGIAADTDGPLFRTHGALDRYAASHDAVGCLRDDRALCEAGGHPDENRQSHAARHRHHRLPQKRRLAGRSPQDGEPCRGHAHPRSSMTGPRTWRVWMNTQRWGFERDASMDEESSALDFPDAFARGRFAIDL
jgi:integrase